MTAKDTHELRLHSWPRLSTFPTTNGMLVLVMLLWATTGFCAMAFALLEHIMQHAHGVSGALAVPDRWYGALEVFTGIVVVQFIGKRGTDAGLWQRKPRDKAEGSDASGQ